MRCICGAQFRDDLNLFRHFTSPIHKNWMNFEKTYMGCSICYNIRKHTRFIKCKICRNEICDTCYNNLYIYHTGVVRCPYCRNTTF